MRLQQCFGLNDKGSTLDVRPNDKFSLGLVKGDHLAYNRDRLSLLQAERENSRVESCTDDFHGAK